MGYLKVLEDKQMNNTKNRFRWENESQNPKVNVTFEGETLAVPAGSTVAAALLGHNADHVCESAASQEKRSPYCLMGVCFECLVEIDGIKNRQACLEPVLEGMNIKRQKSVVEQENTP